MCLLLPLLVSLAKIVPCHLSLSLFLSPALTEKVFTLLPSLPPQTILLLTYAVSHFFLCYTCDEKWAPEEKGIALAGCSEEGDKVLFSSYRIVPA